MQAVLARRPSTHAPERIDLVAMAQKQLGRHPHFRGRATALSFDQRGKTLFVTGQLPSFYLKQLVQETLRHLPGIQGVQNDIDVVSPHGISSVRS